MRKELNEFYEFFFSSSARSAVGGLMSFLPSDSWTFFQHLSPLADYLNSLWVRQLGDKIWKAFYLCLFTWSFRHKISIVSSFVGFEDVLQKWV